MLIMFALLVGKGPLMLGLLDGHSGSSPFELVNDGDLLLIVDKMLHRA